MLRQSVKHQETEQGFVLATALVMLSLLTLMAVSMFFTGRTSVHVSSSAQHSTEGHYFAETAVNYMIWAMRNDAEFDSFSYGGGGALFVIPTDDPSNGDWSELTGNTWIPGPTVVSDTDSNGLIGQVMYYDNSPMSDRETRGGLGAIVWPLPTSGGEPVYPTLFNISTRLPRYIRLDIDSAGSVMPSIPALPHIASPATDGSDDVPENGAIVWLTSGNSATDFELDSAAGFPSCAANPITGGEVACDKNSGKWLRTTGTAAAGDLYGVVVYAIGYVGGRPSSIIRAQIK